MAKSYFTILGVTATASPDEIRAAYRRLAKEFHPDYFSGGSEAFIQIQEAYAVLSDARKRNAYEQSLRESAAVRPAVAARRPTPEPLVPEHRPFDMGEIWPMRSFHRFTPSFEEIFDRLWNNYASIERPKSGRVQTLTMKVPITREEARHGGNVRIMVPVHAACPICQGRGGVSFYECYRCGGEGAISGEMPVSLSFPPGIDRDHAVVIPLERFGIPNLRLTVLFRLTDEW